MSGYSSGGEDLERIFFTESELVDQFVGNALWSWGLNATGIAGNGTVTNSSTPATTADGAINWVSVSCNYSQTPAGHAAGVKTDGTLWTWGYNASGQLGNGTVVARSSPGTTAGGGTSWKQVSCGYTFMAAIKTDGTLWTWGANDSGQLGTNSTTNRSSPDTTVGGGTTWKQVAAAGLVTPSGGHCVAVKTDGTLWTWGLNDRGQLGDGTVVNKSSPNTTAGGGTNWKTVASNLGNGRNSAAIKTDGTLWTWGNDSYGQLGFNTQNAHRSSPGTTAGGGANWKQVSFSNSRMHGIKTDGTLWTWGAGAFGALGSNSTTNRSSPVTIFGSGTDWKFTCSGGPVGAAVKTDGTLWTWGLNDTGALGDGTTTNRSTPGTIVGSLANWKQVVCGYRNTLAIGEK